MIKKHNSLKINGLKTNDLEANTADVDLTPMLDVIFILLIFFIVTASFVKETGLLLNKPKSSSREKSNDPTIVVNVLEAGQLKIKHNMIDPRILKPTMLRLVAEQPTAKVAIKVHKRAKASAVIKTIDSLHSANIFHPPVSLIGG